MIDGIGIKGRVRVIRKDVQGKVISDTVHENTATDWACAVLAQLLITPPNQEINALQTSRPLYISLGNGTGTASHTDQFMFGEVYQGRKPVSYTSNFQATSAQLTTNFLTSDINGTFTEAAMWDSDVSDTSLSASAAQGAESISVPSSAPSVLGSTIPGQYTTIYINDGANSEYASIATTAAQGSTSWQLQSGLQYAHASGTPIVAFTGNLWAHVMFSGAGESKGIGETLTIQWTDAIQPV